MGRAVTCTTKWTGPCPMWGEFHHCAHASLIHDGDHGCECGQDVAPATPLADLGLSQRLTDWGVLSAPSRADERSEEVGGGD